MTAGQTKNPPRPCAPTAWFNNKINVVRGWCCSTHLFGVNAFLHAHYLVLIAGILNDYIVTPLSPPCGHTNTKKPKVFALTRMAKQ